MYSCKFKSYKAGGSCGPAGAQGDPGPAGAQGATGAQGPPGSGGGGGGGGSWDISFDYYFMQKPWSPGYITDPSFSPPIDMSRGVFDASSAIFDTVDQRMELNWVLPPRECAAFNFSVAPRQLNDGTINLEAGVYSADGINDACYNYLPYHETLHIDYRTKNPSTGVISAWTTLTPANLALAGTPQPNLYIQTIGAYFKAGTGSSTGDYGPIAGPPSVPQYIYQNENYFQVGNSQYQFRIYLKNKSCQVLPTPDYFGTVDPEWNYLYMPDVSSSFLVFGQFGPATSPQLINISATDYRRLNISGANNNPNPGAPVADASLNTPFTDLPLYGLHVNYGFDLSGQPDPSSKQVFLPPAPYLTIPDISYVSNNITSNNWVQNQISSNFTPTPATNDFSVITNDIIFPGYEYEVSEYFMKINTDLSYNVYTDNYPVPTPYPTVIVGPPTRNQVSIIYRQLLGGTGQNSFFTNTDLTNGQVSGTAAVIASAYPKNSNTIINNIYFFSSNSVYQLSNNTYTYELVNKRDANESTDLGTDLTGNNMCRFKLSTTASTPTDLTSVYRVGFTGADALVQPTNSFFEMSISESKDATQLPGGTTAEAYRIRGWYLGVDVSNVVIKDINLTNYPDISNNSYNDWDITLTQDFAGTQADQTLTYDLRIGEKPTVPVSMSNFQAIQQTPTLAVDFFGLARPNTATVATIPVSATLSGLNPTWRPVQSQWLMNGALFYANANSSTSGNSFDTYGQVWSNTHPTTVNMSENVQLLKSSLTSAAYDYSRERNFNPQFYITGTYTNNVTLTPGTTTVSPLDVSFNQKFLWWDFTWNNTSNNPPGTWTSQSGNITFSTDFMNVGSGLYPTVNGGGTTDPFNAYTHTTIIPNNMMMWANGAIRAGQGGSANAYDNPFIDYTQYYEDASTPSIQQDYSSYDGNGLTIGTISYTQSSVNIYYDGTSSQPTWQTNTAAKSIVIKVNNPIDTAISGGTNNIRILVKNGGSTLTLGSDYFLQVLERYTGSGSAPYPLASGSNAFFTGWRDAQKSNQFATAPSAKTGDGDPCFMNGLNTTTDFFVETINQNTGGNTVVQYLRITMPHNSTNKITQIIVNFG